MDVSMEHVLKQKFSFSDLTSNGQRMLNFFSKKYSIPKKVLGCFGGKYCTNLDSFADIARSSFD